MKGSLKRAVDWIARMLEVDPGVDRLSLVDEAGRKFGLSPPDCDFLIRKFARKQ